MATMARFFPLWAATLKGGGEVARFAARGTPSALAKFLPQPSTPFSCLAAETLAGAFIVSPGQTPAQEAKLSAEGNSLIFTRVSAMTVQAVVRSKPVISANKETAS